MSAGSVGCCRCAVTIASVTSSDYRGGMLDALRWWCAALVGSALQGHVDVVDIEVARVVLCHVVFRIVISAGCGEWCEAGVRADGSDVSRWCGGSGWHRDVLLTRGRATTASVGGWREGTRVIIIRRRSYSVDVRCVGGVRSGTRRGVGGGEVGGRGGGHGGEWNEVMERRSGCVVVEMERGEE